MKLSVFCGVSVDGFLARPDHGLDFLDAGGHEPHGFEEFYGSVDVLVIGRKTFGVVRSFGEWPYGKKQVVVLSSRPLDLASIKDGVVEQMSGEPSEVAARLAPEPCRDRDRGLCCCRRRKMRRRKCTNAQFGDRTGA